MYSLWIQLHTRDEGPSPDSEFYWSLFLTDHTEFDPGVPGISVVPFTGPPYMPVFTCDPARGPTAPHDTSGAALLEQLSYLDSNASLIAYIRVGNIPPDGLDDFTTLLPGVPAVTELSQRTWVMEALRRLRDIGMVDTPPIDDSFEWSVVKHGAIGIAVRGDTPFVASNIYTVDFGNPISVPQSRPTLLPDFDD